MIKLLYIEIIYLYNKLRNSENDFILEIMKMIEI